MMLTLVLTGLAILIAWTVLDVLLHRLVLRSWYERDPQLWRPFDRLNAGLIYLVTALLIASYILLYWLLIRPKSLGAGLGFGSVFGVALGLAVAGGTYIHMPIPRPLAWGWLAGGCLRGLVAGAILGALIHEG